MLVVAAISAMLLASQGMARTAAAVGVATLAGAVACAADAGVGLDWWQSVHADAYGFGYGPARIVQLLCTLMPGLQCLPVDEMGTLFTGYSLIGGAYVLGTAGLAVFAASLAALVAGLVRLWRLDGHPIALAAAAFIALCAVVSVADQLSLLPLYYLFMPFLDALCAVQAPVLFLVSSCCMFAPQRAEGRQGIMSEDRDAERPADRPSACQPMRIVRGCICANRARNGRYGIWAITGKATSSASLGTAAWS